MNTHKESRKDKKGWEEVWKTCEKCNGTGKYPRSDGGYYETMCHWCLGRGVYWTFGDKRDTRLKPIFI